MFTKRLLFLTNHRLVSVVWKRNRARQCQVFPLGEAGRKAFSSHVAELPGAPAYLLTELVEEDFRSDTIPHVIGRDRRAIIQRKLSQIYRNTPYRVGFLLGREIDGRRDDRVLYTAITNPELVKPWVDLLIDLGVPFAGVYSAPLLSVDLLKALRIGTEHALLVSVETGGGLRQTYFYQGKIKFSRLTPVSEIAREELAAFIADEVGKTWQYLDSLRYFTRADTLDVFVLAHPDDHPALMESRPNITQLRYNAVNLTELAKRIGVEEVLQDTDATPIFIQLLGQQPRGQFASHEETHGMRIWKSRVALYATAALLLACSAVYSGYTSWQSTLRERDIARTEIAAQALADRHRAAVANLPPSPVSPAFMRDSVVLYDALVDGSPSPTGSLGRLAEVLGRFPNIRVMQIVWGLSNDREATLNYTPAAGGSDGPVRSTSTDTAAARQQQALPDDKGAALGATYQVAVVEADIQPFTGDYRSALAEIERFEAALKGLPGVTVEVLARPVDLTSNATLSGRATDNRDSQARFAVRLSSEFSKSSDFSKSGESSNPGEVSKS